MSMEDEKRGFDEGYDAGYLIGIDKGHDAGYSAGYNDCSLDRRENWINFEHRYLVEILEWLDNHDMAQVGDLLEKAWGNGELKVDPPDLIESRPVNRIKPHLENVLSNAILNGQMIGQIKK